MIRSRVEVTDSDKRSSLFGYEINYDRKKFHITDHNKVQSYKTFYVCNLRTFVIS
jgi:hypothetical protein